MPPKWTGFFLERSGVPGISPKQTAGLPLDFFVTTSSIAAIWGSFGQTAYAAANAFLDGLAWWQRTHGIAG